jgi:hypothetical protein
MILEVLPKIIEMNLRGIYNFVNEGAILISEILKLRGVEHTVVPFDNSRPTGLLCMKNLSSVLKITPITSII